VLYNTTGKEPEEYGVYSRWRFSRYKLLDKLAHWGRYNVPVIRRMSTAKLKRTPCIFDLRPRPLLREDLRIPTIFDLVKLSVVLFVPSYSEEPWIRDYYSEAFEKRVEEAEKAIWRVHEYRKRRLLEELKRNSGWRLFMAWFDLADWMNSFYMDRSKLKITKAYFKLNRLAVRVKEMVPKDTLFMIVGGHDMEPRGRYSSRAFYSFNIDPEWRQCLSYYLQGAYG